jgi:hypothetical protein
MPGNFGESGVGNADEHVNAAFPELAGLFRSIHDAGGS